VLVIHRLIRSMSSLHTYEYSCIFSFGIFTAFPPSLFRTHSSVDKCAAKLTLVARHANQKERARCGSYFFKSISLSRNQTLVLLLFIIIKRVRHLHANLLVQQGGDVALAAVRIYSAQNRSIDFSPSLARARRIKTIIFSGERSAKS
jgi:hypothetical protein